VSQGIRRVLSTEGTSGQTTEQVRIVHRHRGCGAAAMAAGRSAAFNSGGSADVYSHYRSPATWLEFS
jgi:hypothetical protein